MARGGARLGAGRKRRKGNRLTEAAKEHAIAVLHGVKGVTPLQVMAKTMQALWEEANALNEEGKPAFDPGKAMAAHAVAKDMAPYVHPRLNPIDAIIDKPPIENNQISELERARRVAFTLVRGAKLSAAGLAPVPQPSKPKAKQAHSEEADI